MSGCTSPFPAGLLAAAGLVTALPSHAAVQRPNERSGETLGLDVYFEVPADNPLTAVKVALGRLLFFDPLLSVDTTVACASCHLPRHAFADTARFSVGVRGRQTARNTPSILNRAYGRAFFWDGRERTLEETVLQPITDPREMDLGLVELVLRLRRDTAYSRAFATVFPSGVTEQNVARALASFVRTLVAGGAPIDRFLHGDAGALSPAARRGRRLFNGKANCVACHAGPTFTDDAFHNTGISLGGDPGRYLVTGRDADRGRFKAPSLRNVALTAPYMHDGSLATLDDVVAFYDRGGRENRYLDPAIRSLRLADEEARALVAFLRSLTSLRIGQ